jgi:hypothetical protein
MRERPEVQTTIDECSDGSWEGVLYVGSNFICRLHEDSFLLCAAALAAEIHQVEKEHRDESS